MVGEGKGRRFMPFFTQLKIALVIIFYRCRSRSVENGRRYIVFGYAMNKTILFSNGAEKVHYFMFSLTTRSQRGTNISLPSAFLPFCSTYRSGGIPLKTLPMLSRFRL
jgi:hypothetical protein